MVDEREGGEREELGRGGLTKGGLDLHMPSCYAMSRFR